MLMRLTWAKVRPGTWSQYELRYREVASAPVMGRQTQWLARDSNDPDAIFIVSLWDNADSIKAWEMSNHFVNVYVPTLKPFLDGEHSVSVCEVRDRQGEV